MFPNGLFFIENFFTSKILLECRLATVLSALILRASVFKRGITLIHPFPGIRLTKRIFIIFFLLLLKKKVRGQWNASELKVTSGFNASLYFFFFIALSRQKCVAKCRVRLISGLQKVMLQLISHISNPLSRMKCVN